MLGHNWVTGLLAATVLLSAAGCAGSTKDERDTSLAAPAVSATPTENSPSPSGTATRGAVVLTLPLPVKPFSDGLLQDATNIDRTGLFDLEGVPPVWLQEYAPEAAARKGELFLVQEGVVLAEVEEKGSGLDATAKYIVSLDPQTGAELWRQPATALSRNDLIADAGYIYQHASAAGSRKAIQRINEKTGDVMWKVDFRYLRSYPFVVGDDVYLPNRENESLPPLVYVVDNQTGRKKREIKTDTYQGLPLFQNSTGMDTLGRFLVNSEGKLSLQTADQKTVWEVPAGPVSAMAVGESGALAVGDSGDVVLLDGDTGRTTATIPAEALSATACSAGIRDAFILPNRRAGLVCGGTTTFIQI